jgi:hypothetical protein
MRDKSHVEPLTVRERTFSAVPPPLPVTVSPVKPEMLPEMAVMVVVPADPDEACPLEPAALLMVAKDGNEESQVTEVVIF